MKSYLRFALYLKADEILFEVCIVSEVLFVVVRGNEMVLVILGLLSSISTSISDLDCDSFKMLIN
jgi:hypothetical protein